MWTPLRWLSLLALGTLLIAACGGRGSTSTPTPGATATPLSTGVDRGHALFLSKGCAVCHGQNAEGSVIAPALPGHSEAIVKRQVSNPRFQMPAFNETQISDGELDAIAHYIASLPADNHAHPEAIELTAAVEMHYWMALDALKADDRAEAIHHVEHVIELLEAGEHLESMETVLEDLQAGETHDAEHEIEETLAKKAAPDLSLFQLHLRQALVAIAVEDLSDARHHVEHANELAGAAELERVVEILGLLEQGDLHEAEHEIEELLGEGEAHSD